MDTVILNSLKSTENRIIVIIDLCTGMLDCPMGPEPWKQATVYKLDKQFVKN